MTRIESHTFGDHFRKEKSCQNLWMKGTIIMISGVISVETEVMLFYVISVNLCFTGIAWIHLLKQFRRMIGSVQFAR